MAQTYIIRKGPDNTGEVLFEFTIDITNPQDYTNYTWDSKTGLITATEIMTNKTRIIPANGNTIGAIPAGAFNTEGITQIDYNYWYN
jgi:hypothetical protein